MRILHVVGALNRGGAETWLVQVLRHIDRAKVQFDFLVHGTEPGAYDEEVKALGARVIPCLKPSNPLQYAINFRRALCQFGPYDCVHSHVHSYTGYVLMLAAGMRVPMRIAHSHSDTRTLDSRSWILRKIYLSAMKSLIRRFATAGIAVSEYAAQALFPEKWRSDPRWSLCPLGIDLGPFHQMIDAEQVRADMGIPSDAFVIGHAGRFVEVKNHRLIVDIAEYVCRWEPRAMFLLLGDGPLRPETEALVRSRGLSERFIFAGVRADVPRLMKGAMDCFLLPSLYEGLPLVLLEAQAAGLRCIVSDTVSNEGDRSVPGVIHLPLSASPDLWASHLQQRSLHAEPERPDTWAWERSIEASTERLVQHYDPPERQTFASVDSRSIVQVHH
jgi:glycosyltransferase involved in cell wall biosynthesis